MAIGRYSPAPIESYKSACMFKLLVDDEVAWNLAYLSWDFEANHGYPDAYFSTHCHRTLQFVISTGELDLASKVPNELKVRGLMSGPAPQVVLRIINLSRVRELPLFRAYGQNWLDTLIARSRLYREPYDAEFDFEIKSIAHALDVVQKF